MAVYFVRDTTSGLIKIGVAVDPWKRLGQMQSGSAAKLELVRIIEGDRETERGLHRQHSAQRYRGEWFIATGPLAELADLPALSLPVRPKGDAFWNGMTRTEMERATGISGPMLSRIRKGDRVPSPEFAIRIQRACGLSAIKLIFGELAGEAQ